MFFCAGMSLFLVMILVTEYRLWTRRFMAEFDRDWPEIDPSTLPPYPHTTMRHTVIFARENEPGTNLLLLFHCKTPDTSEAFKQFHSAVHQWLTTTYLGESLIKESGGDFNIGDFASGLPRFAEDQTFRDTCREFGVTLENVQTVDLHVPYDRRLCEPPKTN